MKATRKNFLKTSAVITAGALINNSLLEAAVNKLNQQSDELLYTLPKLGYAYDALEPYIDAKTMEIHYTKHHQAYVTKLNEAIAKDASLKGHKLDHLIAHINQVPEPLRAAIRNQGGGHWNHSFFWQLLKTKTTPSAKVTEAINKDFGSMDEFKKQFEKAATGQFGSGWAWLIKSNGKLQVTATANQDNPLMDIALTKGTPIIALDVWEHAYYLKYQNKRADYVSAFWNVLDWNKVESLLFS